jgi:hypothetical protein
MPPRLLHFPLCPPPKIHVHGKTIHMQRAEFEWRLVPMVAGEEGPRGRWPGQPHPSMP